MALDGAGEAFAYSRSDDVDFLAFFKEIDFDLLAQLKLSVFRPIRRIKAKFSHKVPGFNLCLREVAGFRFGYAGRFSSASSYLQCAIAITLHGFHLSDLVRLRLNDGDRY